MNNDTNLIMKAAIQFFVNRTPLARYLGVQEFCEMTEAEYRSWNNGSDAPLQAVRDRLGLGRKLAA